MKGAGDALCQASQASTSPPGLVPQHATALNFRGETTEAGSLSLQPCWQGLVLFGSWPQLHWAPFVLAHHDQACATQCA